MNLGERWRLGDGAAQVIDSTRVAAGAQFGETEFAFEGGCRGLAFQGSSITAAGRIEISERVVGVGSGFLDERGAVAEAFGAGERGERIGVAAEAGFGERGEEPGDGETRIQPARLFETGERRFVVVEIVEFDEAQLEMRLGVGGHFENLLPAEFAIQLVFPAAGFLRGHEAEMMNQDAGFGEPGPGFDDARADAFVDAANETDFRRAAEQAHVLVRDVGGIGIRFGQAEIVGNGGTVPETIAGRERVIANGDLVTGDGRCGSERGKPGRRGGIEALVGVKDEDPIGADFGEGEIARAGEVVVPGNLDDAGAEAAGERLRAVGRAGIGDDDFVDGFADASEAAFEIGGGVANDHRESERHRGSVSRMGISREGVSGGDGLRADIFPADASIAAVSAVSRASSASMRSR